MFGFLFTLLLGRAWNWWLCLGYTTIHMSRSRMWTNTLFVVCYFDAMLILWPGIFIKKINAGWTMFVDAYGNRMVAYIKIYYRMDVPTNINFRLTESQAQHIVPSSFVFKTLQNKLFIHLYISKRPENRIAIKCFYCL